MQISETKKTALAFLVIVVSFVAFPSIESLVSASTISPPLMPDTGIAEASSTVSAAHVEMPDTSTPVTLSIPTIKLEDSIVGVGTNSKGEMDVPSGSTSNVGWYQYGTIPGQVGSAVVDAHVFAAFAQLRKLKVGDDLYVLNQSGQQLDFRVEEIDTYKLADVPADKLFNRADEPRLNLITCAGQLTADHSTYDHRLVVYAVLVDTK